MNQPTTVTRPCGRCLGRGHINGFSHVAGGRCFACGGSGTFADSADWREREARAEARRQRRDAARRARDAGPRLWEQFAAEHPNEAATIWAGKDTDPILGMAYTSIAVYDPRDQNLQQALRLAREWRASQPHS